MYDNITINNETWVQVGPKQGPNAHPKKKPKNMYCIKYSKNTTSILVLGIITSGDEGH